MDTQLQPQALPLMPSIPNDSTAPLPFYQRKLFKISIIFILVLFIFFLAYYFFIPHNSIVIVDQSQGAAVIIKSLTLTHGGYVMIREYDSQLDQAGSSVGVTEYLPADTYTVIPINLLAENLRRERGIDLAPGKILLAVVYERPNPTSALLTGEDKVARDWLGRKLVKKFKLR